MHNYLKYLALLLFVLIIQAMTVGSAHAIPAFSREHNTECSTCHTIFPELNEYGDAFLKNGFVWAKHGKGDSQTDKKSAVKGEGDSEMLKKLKEVATVGNPKKADDSVPAGQAKSEPLWLAGLPQTLPISLSATLNASYNDDADYDKLDLSTRAVSLLAGGVLRDKIGFYLKYNLYVEGEYDPAVSNTPLNMGSPYSNDLEQFYLIWRNSFGTPVNIKAGRFRPQLSLWQKSNKPGVSDFATTSYRVGSSNFTTDATNDAIEANAVLFNRFYVAGGIVDRDGQDSNEGYGHISVKIGGSDFHGKEPDLDLDKESILDYMYLTIGGYGYFGRNALDSASSKRNDFFRGGVDMDFVMMNARLKLAWAHGEDKSPYVGSDQEVSTDVFAAQGEYLFTTGLMGLFRYEYQNVGHDDAIQRYIPAIVYAPLQNAKFTLEYQHASADNSDDSNLFLLGVRVAF
jgi:hypothetical protein